MPRHGTTNDICLSTNILGKIKRIAERIIRMSSLKER